MWFHCGLWIQAGWETKNIRPQKRELKQLNFPTSMLQPDVSQRDCSNRAEVSLPDRLGIAPRVKEVMDDVCEVDHQLKRNNVRELVPIK